MRVTGGGITRWWELLVLKEAMVREVDREALNSDRGIGGVEIPGVCVVDQLSVITNRRHAFIGVRLRSKGNICGLGRGDKKIGVDLSVPWSLEGEQGGSGGLGACIVNVAEGNNVVVAEVIRRLLGDMSWVGEEKSRWEEIIRGNWERESIVPLPQSDGVKKPDGNLEIETAIVDTGAIGPIAFMKVRRNPKWGRASGYIVSMKYEEEEFVGKKRIAMRGGDNLHITGQVVHIPCTKGGMQGVNMRGMRHRRGLMKLVGLLVEKANLKMAGKSYIRRGKTPKLVSAEPYLVYV